jgi:predicted RNA-binding Zn-ribbon protein involved in translation (DUF1610 family)
MLIYKITSPNTDLVYVGQTNKTLKWRFQKHHSSYKAWLAGKPKAIYCTSYKVLEHGDARIELIEETDDEDYWINAIPNTCNERRGLFDRAAYSRAYREENKEEINARASVHYAENKEEINARRRQKEPCPKCGTVVTRGAMTRHQRSKSCQNHSV